MRNVEPKPSGMTVQEGQTMTTKTLTRVDTGLVPVFFAAALGLGLLFVSGYAQATILHDAAHDQRHAMAFPCH